MESYGRYVAAIGNGHSTCCDMFMKFEKSTLVDKVICDEEIKTI